VDIVKKNWFIVKIQIIISFIVIACLFYYIFNFFFVGFEFTDETTYLFYISYPLAYDLTASKFGWIYHPLFSLLSGDVGLIRAVNFLIIIIVFLCLSRLFIEYFKPVGFILSWPWLWLLALTVAAPALVIYNPWLPTPNYNSLLFISIGLALTGVLSVGLQKKLKLNKSIWFFGWLIIGVSGFLAFMAKPQSAAGLAALILLWAWLGGHFKVKAIVIAIVAAFALLLVSAFILDGSISGFINRYSRIIATLEESGSHSPFRLFNFDFSYFLDTLNIQFGLSFLAWAGFGAVLAALSEKGYSPVWFLVLLAAHLSLAVKLLIEPSWPWGDYNLGHLLWAGPLGATLYSLRETLFYGKKFCRPQIGWFVFLITQTFIYGLGTNNLITLAASTGAFFIFLGFLALLAWEQEPLKWTLKVTGLTALSLIMTVNCLAAAWARPYRQIAPLWTYDSPIPIPWGGFVLKTHPLMFSFLVDWYAAAKIGKFKPGTPIIDMTGRSFGAAYVLNGILPISPWIEAPISPLFNSTLKASEFYGRTVLYQLSCEQLAQAWIVTDADGVDIFEPVILEKAGLDHVDQYQAIGSAIYPVGRTVHGTVKFRTLVLLKPIFSVDERAALCLERRAKNSPGAVNDLN
jgi:hypothetical protein